MAHVYILKSLSDGRFYVGSTKNLETRLIHHEKGHTPSTKRFNGVKLIFSQEYPNLKQARYIEKRLKKLKRKDYLKKIVADGHIKIIPA